MRRARKLAMVVVGAAMLALSMSAPAASAGGGGGALVVGDSLAVLTSPYLKQYLPGVPLTINAEGGYNTFQIFELFEQAYDPSQSVIVFDAGTNDNPAYPEILAENLQKVTEAIGDRCMVVPTVHGFTVDGIDNTGKNRVVEAFAASRPGTQVPDWAAAVAAHPELMQADNLHPIAEGAEHRAQLIAEGIRACLGFTTEAEREPALASAPHLQRVSRIASQQAATARAIATELARQIGARIAGQQPLLAAVALTMASPDA